MKKLIILITPRLEHAHTVGERWQRAGARSATFIESFGLQRIKEVGHTMEVLPGMMSMLEILRGRDEHSIMVLSLVDSGLVDSLIAETEQVLGDLEQPNNGILFVIDIENVRGLGKV